MPSKFEIIDHKLDTIITLLEELTEETELFGDEVGKGSPELEAEMKSQTGEDLGPFTDFATRYKPSATRTHVEVRSADVEGGIEMVPWTEIDGRIIEAVRLSAEQGEPWELWRDPSGMIRVSVEASISHQIRKENTYQPEPPRSTEIPQDMDIDEAMKER